MVNKYDSWSMAYALITPAFNEAAYIERTIEGVLAQTVKPLLWIIVDDGSTDKTAEIIKRYTDAYPWIQYIYRSKEPNQSYYSSNVYAIQEGINQIHNSKFPTHEPGNFDFLAILDADISLPADYYSQILKRMKKDGKLGIASGVYIDRIGEDKFRKVLNDRRSTPKALMVFRKECYQDIGGFTPMKYGYEDTCACYMARMKGWKTWSFPDINAIHNKPVGTGHSSKLLIIRFRLGIGEYFIGSHPLFALLKSLKRCFKEKPFVLGGLARFAGYLYGTLMREKRQIPDALVHYIRKEQTSRIWNRNKISFSVES